MTTERVTMVTDAKVTDSRGRDRAMSTRRARIARWQATRKVSPARSDAGAVPLESSRMGIVNGRNADPLVVEEKMRRIREAYDRRYAPQREPYSARSDEDRQPLLRRDCFEHRTNHEIGWRTAD